jgi:hypothetical protein
MEASSMRIKIAKRKHQKINDIDGLIDWADKNIDEMSDHYKHGCDYAVLWAQTALRYEQTDSDIDCASYVAAILGYIASHHPQLLGSEYKYAVIIEARKRAQNSRLQ